MKSLREEMIEAIFGTNPDPDDVKAHNAMKAEVLLEAAEVMALYDRLKPKSELSRRGGPRKLVGKKWV